MAEDMAHDLRVVVKDHQRGTHEAEKEDGAHKQPGVKVVRKIVEGAGREVALWKCIKVKKINGIFGIRIFIYFIFVKRNFTLS